MSNDTKNRVKLYKLIEQIVEHYDGDIVKAYHEFMNNGGINVFDGNYVDDLMSELQHDDIYDMGREIFEELARWENVMLPIHNRFGFEY